MVDRGYIRAELSYITRLEFHGLLLQNLSMRYRWWPPRDAEEDCLQLFIFSFAHKLWAKCIWLRIKRVESFRVAKISRRLAFDSWQRSGQILTDWVDDSFTQIAFGLLLLWCLIQLTNRIEVTPLMLLRLHVLDNCCNVQQVDLYRGYNRCRSM